MGFPYLNNIMLPTKWPKGRVVRIVGRSCAQVSSNLEQREKELTYCSISRIEKWGDSGLQSIHTEQKDHEWSRATWHQGKVYAKVIKSVISVFYVAIFTFFFFLITSWHSLRPEEMWRIAVFQKSEKNEKKVECHHFFYLFFKIWTMTSLVMATLSSDFLETLRTPTKAMIHLGW